MIRVNLLPPEYRKLESTPLARFIAIRVGALLIASELGVYGYVRYSELRSVREVRTATEAEYQNKKAQADVSLNLRKEIQAYEARRKAIQQVASRRILWSRKLDEFLDILHNKGDRHEYFVWLKKLQVAPPRAQGRRKGPGSGGNFTFEGFSESIEFSKVTNLRNAVRKDAFFRDFQRISRPNFEAIIWDDEKTPDRAGRFSFSLELKALGWDRSGKK
ncbi:MAG: PilN domain-containing protein [Planctomycetota bacterium]